MKYSFKLAYTLDTPSNFIEECYTLLPDIIHLALESLHCHEKRIFRFLPPTPKTWRLWLIETKINLLESTSSTQKTLNHFEKISIFGCKSGVLHSSMQTENGWRERINEAMLLKE
jgi:hypothetical protein